MTNVIKTLEIKKYDVLKIVYVDATYIFDLSLLNKSNLIPPPIISFGLLIHVNESTICIATEWATDSDNLSGKEQFKIRPVFEIIIPINSILEISKLAITVSGSDPKFDKVISSIDNSLQIDSLKEQIEQTLYPGDEVTIDWNDIKLKEDIVEPIGTEGGNIKTYPPTWMQIKGIFEGIAQNFIFISKPNNINMDKLIPHPKVKPELFCIPFEIIMKISKGNIHNEIRHKTILNDEIFKSYSKKTNYIEKKLNHRFFSWNESHGARLETRHSYAFITEETSDSIKIASTSNVAGFTEIKIISKNKLI